MPRMLWGLVAAFLIVVGGLVVAAFLIVEGCNRAEPYLQVFRDQHAAWVETTKILVEVKDESSMEAAKDKLADQLVRCQNVARRAKGMAQPSEAVLEQLKEESRHMTSAVQKMQAEIERVGKLPGGQDFLKDLAQIVRGSR